LLVCAAQLNVSAIGLRAADLRAMTLDFLMMRTICVYCGSSPGERPEFLAAARHVGELIGRGGHRLVYGGGNVGLMGAVADAAMLHGAKAIGVIPQRLVDKEVAHDELSELITVDSMHERKHTMAELADCFLALPGGVGTLEEIIEVLVWTQLGIHQKPCGLLNVTGYYDRFIAFLDHMRAMGFLKDYHHAQLLVGDDPEQLIDRLLTTKVEYLDKWKERRR
jgi:uncharacterized protein (TIGR00730 family)